jgi:hypothetical protein
MALLQAWIETHWKFPYLLYSAVVCVAVVYLVTKFSRARNGAQRAATIWGSIGFALLLFYLLGASDSREQFLSLFGFGAIGTALGYLTGVWLAPSSLSEENRFAKAQNLLATLAAGAVGTKLLGLWDDITKGESKLIYQPAYYLPLLCGLVGFFIALAAFYTLRSFSSGQVKITAPANQFIEWLDSNQKSHNNGVPAGKSVQFSGAADFDDDVSVSWGLKQQEKQMTTVDLPAITMSATGLLSAPSTEWVTANPGAVDWSVVATSNRDRSKWATYDIHFVGS